MSNGVNKFCPKCGSEAGVEVKFCPKCGTALLPEWEIGVRKEIKYGAIGCGGCLTLILGLITFLLALRDVPNILGFIISSIAAITPCIFYVLIIYWLDRHEKEPLYLLLIAFLWGALVSTFFSYIINTINAYILAYIFGKPELSAILSAPWVEETAKGAALLILFIFMRHEFDNVTDGIIYGAIVGLGFAMTENITYYGRQYMQYGVAGVGLLFIIRSILHGFGHALYTGTTGAGLGFARQTKMGLPVKIIVPIIAFGLAIAQHFLWNLNIPIPARDEGTALVLVILVIIFKILFLVLPAILVLLGIAYFSLRQEKQVIKEQLLEELKNGVILAEEYEALTRGGRLKREWGILWQKGVAPWYYLRKLYQLEIGLAFRKWHTARGEKLKGIQRMFSEAAIRAQIANVRAKLI